MVDHLFIKQRWSCQAYLYPALTKAHLVFVHLIPPQIILTFLSSLYLLNLHFFQIIL